VSEVWTHDDTRSAVRLKGNEHRAQESGPCQHRRQNPLRECRREPASPGTHHEHRPDGYSHAHNRTIFHQVGDQFIVSGDHATNVHREPIDHPPRAVALISTITTDKALRPRRLAPGRHLGSLLSRSPGRPRSLSEESSEKDTDRLASILSAPCH
jgi:hypothetical protein